MPYEYDAALTRKAVCATTHTKAGDCNGEREQTTREEIDTP